MAAGCGPCGSGGNIYDPWKPVGGPAKAGDHTVYEPEVKGRKRVYDVISKFGTVTHQDRQMADLAAGQNGGRVSMRYVTE